MAETEEERRLREEEEARKQRSGFSLDWLNPANWFSGIGGIFDGIGTLFSFIIPALIMAPVLYFVAQNDSVQEWIGKFFDDKGKEGSGKAKVKEFVENADLMLAGALDAVGMPGMLDAKLAEMPLDKIKKNLAKKGASPEMVQAIAPTKDAALEVINLIRKDGSLTNITGDKTIYALLSQRPALIAKLLATVKPSEANQGAVKPGAVTSDDQKKTIDEVLASLRSIVADGRIDTLLAPGSANQAQYLQMLLPQLPGVSLAQLTRIVNLGFGADGKMTDEFRNILTEALTADETARNKALQKFTALVMKRDKTALTDIVQAIDPSRIEDEALRQKAEILKSLGPKGQKAALALSASGVDLEAEMAFLVSGRAAATKNLVEHLLDADDLRAKLLKAPEAGQDGNLYNLGVLMDAQKGLLPTAQRSAIDFITTRSVTPSRQERYQNIGALVTLIDAIDKKGDDTENKQVLTQLIDVMRASNDAARKKAISAINPNSFASFMRNHAMEFGVFLKQMNNGTLAPEQRNLINGLRKTFGTNDEGIAEVLADPKGAKFILDTMANPSSFAEKIAAYIPKFIPKGISSSALDLAAAAYLKAQGGEVAENSNAIITLSHFLTPPATTPKVAPKPAARQQ